MREEKREEELLCIAFALYQAPLHLPSGMEDGEGRQTLEEAFTHVPSSLLAFYRLQHSGRRKKEKAKKGEGISGGGW